MTSFKVVVLGEASVGKSSLVQRIVNDAFAEETEPTIGAAFLTKTIRGQRIELWDTAGQERYASLAPMYYRGASGALCVFDVSSRKSLDRAKFWLAELAKSDGHAAILLLVANKCDLPDDKRQVSSAEGRSVARDNNVLYAETSARTGQGVAEAFDALVAAMLESSSNRRPQSTEKPVELVASPRKAEGGCC